MSESNNGKKDELAEYDDRREKRWIYWVIAIIFAIATLSAIWHFGIRDAEGQERSGWFQYTDALGSIWACPYEAGECVLLMPGPNVATNPEQISI